MPAKFSNYARGFTLIELLVVIFIVSITAGLLLVNISFGTAEDKLKEESLRLQSLLRFAHEQAIIRAEEYGVRFYQVGYRFMILENERWLELDSDRHLTAKDLQDDMEIELFIEDSNVTLNNAAEETDLMKQDLADTKNTDPNAASAKEQRLKPQIFLLSSGELIPEFSARLRIPGVDTFYTIQGTLNGDYTLLNPDE